MQFSAVYVTMHLEMILLKKWVKALIVILSVILAIVLIGSIVLYFTSAKYKFTHDTAVRAYIYHNQLEREIYVFTEDELARLNKTIENTELGKNMINEYEPHTGGPTFSFCLEYNDGRVVQIYAAADLLHINNVPFKVNEAAFAEYSDLHTEIEDKILPLSPELIEEIINKKLPQE